MVKIMSDTVDELELWKKYVKACANTRNLECVDKHRVLYAPRGYRAYNEHDLENWRGKNEINH